jgi:hypothetical protein
MVACLDSRDARKVHGGMQLLVPRRGAEAPSMVMGNDCRARVARSGWHANLDG